MRIAAHAQQLEEQVDLIGVGRQGRCCWLAVLAQGAVQVRDLQLWTLSFLGGGGLAPLWASEP